MKKISSIKTRITIWYTSLMFILIVVVLSLAGSLSYQLSIDSVEKDVILRVTQVSDKLVKRRSNLNDVTVNGEEFKNVSIYEMNGKHIAGQYIYDVANIPFREGVPRIELVDGARYIVYDVKIPGPPGKREIFWLRGVESLTSSILLGRQATAVVLILIPLILLLAACGGYYITKKAFNPINNIIKTANAISLQKDVTKRIDIPADSREDELHRLSLTLNNMLDKIENLIMQEKQFTADASHELRTPISVILAQGEYLLEIASSPKEAELAANIVDRATQVSNLVSGLLLLARIDQNRQKFNKEKVDLAAVVDIAFNSMGSVAEEKNISLVNNISDNIIIEADESLLLSAITNLVSNGIKYGRQSGYVSVFANKTEEKTEITVTDNGVGISKAYIDKIWTRFYRVDDARNDEYGSNGLGLAMVKSIVELHGGKIYVQSEPEKGTEFKIIL